MGRREARVVAGLLASFSLLAPSGAIANPRTVPAPACVMPGHEAVVVSARPMVELGPLVGVETRDRKCFYVVRLRSGAVRAVDAAQTRLRRAYDIVSAPDVVPDVPAHLRVDESPPVSARTSQQPAAGRASDSLTAGPTSASGGAATTTCFTPDTPSVVLDRRGVVLGHLDRVQTAAGKCFYVVRRENGSFWAVDAATAQLGAPRPSAGRPPRR